MKNFKVCSWCVSLCVFDARLCAAQEYRYKSKESKSLFPMKCSWNQNARQNKRKFDVHLVGQWHRSNKLISSNSMVKSVSGSFLCWCTLYTVDCLSSEPRSIWNNGIHSVNMGLMNLNHHLTINGCSPLPKKSNQQCKHFTASASLYPSIKQKHKPIAQWKIQRNKTI